MNLTHDKRSRISKKFGVKVIPNMFIIDKKGKIAFVHTGFNESMIEQLTSELKSVLEG